MVYTGRGPIDHGRTNDRQGGNDRQGNGEGSDALYFFPDQTVSEARVRWILEQGSRDERAWVVSHLLRFALWDDIWTYVTRDDVREMFPYLELPENLRAAWARMLKVEAPVA